MPLAKYNSQDSDHLFVFGTNEANNKLVEILVKHKLDSKFLLNSKIYIHKDPKYLKKYNQIIIIEDKKIYPLRISTRYKILLRRPIIPKQSEITSPVVDTVT